MELSQIADVREFAELLKELSEGQQVGVLLISSGAAAFCEAKKRKRRINRRSHLGNR